MSAHADNLALIERFEVWEHKRSLAAKTMQGRRMKLQSLSRHFGRSLLEVTADDIDAWLRTRNAPAGLAPQSFEGYLRSVRAFYQWAMRERMIEKDPTVDVVRPRLPRPLPRPMDPGDLVRAIEAADDRRAAMLALAAYAGLRCHEIAALRIEEVDFQRKRLLVVKGKGGRDRVIPLHPVVEKHLRRIEPRSGYVFHRVWPHHSPQPIKAGTVSQILSDFLRGLGIDASAHQGRHLFLTTVYEASQDLRVTQELAGHSSPVTTSIYAAWSNARASDAVAAIAYEKGA